MSDAPDEFGRQTCVADLYGTMGGNAAADTRLIAAAPDLYEALEWAERLLSNHSVHEDDLPPIQAALAKARGQ